MTVLLKTRASLGFCSIADDTSPLGKSVVHKVLNQEVLFGLGRTKLALRDAFEARSLRLRVKEMQKVVQKFEQEESDAKESPPPPDVVIEDIKKQIEKDVAQMDKLLSDKYAKLADDMAETCDGWPHWVHVFSVGCPLFLCAEVRSRGCRARCSPAATWRARASAPRSAKGTAASSASSSTCCRTWCGSSGATRRR